MFSWHVSEHMLFSSDFLVLFVFTFSLVGLLSLKAVRMQPGRRIISHFELVILGSGNTETDNYRLVNAEMDIKTLNLRVLMPFSSPWVLGHALICDRTRDEQKKKAGLLVPEHKIAV